MSKTIAAMLLLLALTGCASAPAAATEPTQPTLDPIGTPPLFLAIIMAGIGLITIIFLGQLTALRL